MGWHPEGRVLGFLYIDFKNVLGCETHQSPPPPPPMHHDMHQPCTDPCRAQLARQPRPQSDPTQVPISTT